MSKYEQALLVEQKKDRRDVVQMTGLQDCIKCGMHQGIYKALARKEYARGGDA